MQRRKFITLLGGAAVAWPIAVQAQQPERVRRIGIILATTADDAEFQAWVGAFLQALALLGWTIGRNVRIDTRWASANPGEIRRNAAELAALGPDVILAHGCLAKFVFDQSNSGRGTCKNSTSQAKQYSSPAERAA